VQQIFGPNVGLQGLQCSQRGTHREADRSRDRIGPQEISSSSAPPPLQHSLSPQWNAGRSDQHATRTREAFHDNHVSAGFNESDEDILQLAASTRAGLKLRNYAFDVPETSAISR